MECGDCERERLLGVLHAGAAREDAGDEATLEAVSRLLELRNPETLVPLARRLVRAAPGSDLHDELIEGLVEWGADVAPALLEVLEEVPGGGRGGTAPIGLLDVLSRCGARDERIYAALVALLAEEPYQAAFFLEFHGDARAVEPLGRALEGYALAQDVEDVFAHQTVLQLEHALLALGGTLAPSWRAKADTARRLRAAWRRAFWGLGRPLAPRRREVPGRNAPCWCGSGVKYKKCHLDEDRERLPRGP